MIRNESPFHGRACLLSVLIVTDYCTAMLSARAGCEYPHRYIAGKAMEKWSIGVECSGQDNIHTEWYVAVIGEREAGDGR